MSAANVLVSIVVPSYNYAHFLPETIESALSQTHANIEIIIIDDGSTDNTREVAEQLLQQDARIQYVHQVNQGLSAARNTGIKHASGEFVVFLDADDLMHPQKIAAHLEHFASDEKIDISYGESRYFVSGDINTTYANIELTQQAWMPQVSGRAAEMLPTLIVNNIMPVCSVMMRKAAIDKTGAFDTSLRSLEDWDYWLRAAAQDCYFSYSSDSRLAAYIRVHGTSMSQNNLRMLQVQYLLRMQHIPLALQQLQDKKLAKKLLRNNLKKRLRTAVTVKPLMDKLEFKQLIYAESLLQKLKIYWRLKNI